MKKSFSMLLTSFSLMICVLSSQFSVLSSQDDKNFKFLVDEFGPDWSGKDISKKQGIYYALMDDFAKSIGWTYTTAYVPTSRFPLEINKSTFNISIGVPGQGVHLSRHVFMPIHHALIFYRKDAHKFVDNLSVLGQYSDNQEKLKKALAGNSVYASHTYVNQMLGTKFKITSNAMSTYEMLRKKRADFIFEELMAFYNIKAHGLQDGKKASPELLKMMRNDEITYVKYGPPMLASWMFSPDKKGLELRRLYNQYYENLLANPELFEKRIGEIYKKYLMGHPAIIEWITNRKEREAVLPAEMIDPPPAA